VSDPTGRPRPQPAPATPGWYWAIAGVALFLVFPAVGALLWVLHRNEIEDQRAQVISDVLWAEQDLRFHLGNVQDLLEELGRDAAEGRVTPEGLGGSVALLMRNHPWLVQVIWYDPTPAVVAAIPPGVGEFAVGESAGTIPSRETFGFARSLGKPVFSLPYPVVNDDYHVELHVPQLGNDGLRNMMVGVVSLKALLRDAVPWWFAQKYRLQVVDHTGGVLAATSWAQGSGAGMSYALAFDPPGRGLLLQATAYRAGTNLLRNTLAITIVALTSGVLLSLWALRRHVQRRYAAEVALREEHAFREAMEDSVITGLRARDLTGRITYVNPAFCRMVGWTEDELVGRAPPMPYWAPESAEEIRRVHDGILGGSEAFEGIEVRLVRKSGERFDALIYESPLIDAQGRQTGWMGSVLDITERKRAEELYRVQQEKLQFTSRLVAMGEMASTLAHELNQPLSAIASYNTGCMNRLEAGSYARDELIQVTHKIGRQAKRAGEIIRRIYDFVRRTEPRREPCNVNEPLVDALGLLEADARRRGVRVEARLADTLPCVMADRVMIEQVIFNLARNGIEAMRETPAPQRVLSICSETAGDHVAVRVADRGPGIDATMAEQLFVPFFTTKDEGMGMGLNICRSITELHKGRLWFEANPAGGTIFHLTLPLAAT
jgi:two-component system sensor histidine kinase DctS